MTQLGTIGGHILDILDVLLGIIISYHHRRYCTVKVDIFNLLGIKYHLMNQIKQKVNKTISFIMFLTLVTSCFLGNINDNKIQSGPEVIKIMLNSAEHEILNAYQNKKIKKFSIFRLR